jgi:hypothetical protein
MANIDKQQEINCDYGFLGMSFSLDDMHYVWKSCPLCWQYWFNDKDKNNNIIFEIIATRVCGFSFPNGNNELNMLDYNPLVFYVLEGVGSNVPFVVNGNRYVQYYVLVNWIYPCWSILMQTIHELKWKKNSLCCCKWIL